MTGARVQSVEPDRDAAASLLAQGRSTMRSAQIAGVDAESAYALCYQAMLKGMGAALLASGIRITSGAGGHVVTIREAVTLLGLDRPLADRLDDMRRTRHRVFYDVIEVTELELEGAMADAEVLLRAVEQRLESL